MVQLRGRCVLLYFTCLRHARSYAYFLVIAHPIREEAEEKRKLDQVGKKPVFKFKKKTVIKLYVSGLHRDEHQPILQVSDAFPENRIVLTLFNNS